MAGKQKSRAAARREAADAGTVEQVGSLSAPGGFNPDTASHTSCRPQNCELEDSGEKFEGEHTVYRCPRCRFSTMEREEAERLNPDLRS